MNRATYRGAGVDIDEGDRLVELIKPLAQATRREGVLGGLGGFGGLFALGSGRYRDPILVSGTDGVGTKLKLAFAAKRHGTVGIDLVAMSVNDVCVTGAEPLFFLDYYATSRLRAEEAAEVIRGIAEGCREAGCALLGGETAELPGFYAEGEYDLAGFAVGIVERAELIDGSRVRPGDAVLGLHSTGLHSNGYSLARQVLFERAKLDLESRPSELGGRSLGEVLLAPTRIYARAIAALRKATDVHAIAHITGGGIPGNLPRVLPEGTFAQIDPTSWPRPPIFGLVQRLGEIDEGELSSAFNLGIGLCVIVARADCDAARAALRALGQDASIIGRVAEGPAGSEPEVRWGGSPEQP
ncbi:MAG: phosphoribosylformylglycinamidine cyclo-ligase [Deltaproteobacteria bacterium]